MVLANVQCKQKVIHWGLTLRFKSKISCSVGTVVKMLNNFRASPHA